MGVLSFSQFGFADTRPSPSEASTKHSPSEAKGSDTVPVPTIKPSIRKGPATPPLPPTKDKKVRNSMRGVALIKPRAIPKPSAQPQVSTRPAGAQDTPSWVSQEHLEWIEQEVARRVDAALALSKDKNTPAARTGASYKDAGTQVDALIQAARASGAANTRVCIEKKVLALPIVCLFRPLFQIIKQKFSDNMLIIFSQKIRRLSLPSVSKGPTNSRRQRLQNRQYQGLRGKQPRVQSKP